MKHRGENMSAEILTGDINFSNVNESSPSFFKKIGSFIKKCIDAIKKFIANLYLESAPFNKHFIGLKLIQKDNNFLKYININCHNAYKIATTAKIIWY